MRAEKYLLIFTCCLLQLTRFWACVTFNSRSLRPTDLWWPHMRNPSSSRNCPKHATSLACTEKKNSAEFGKLFTLYSQVISALIFHHSFSGKHSGDYTITFQIWLPSTLLPKRYFFFVIPAMMHKRFGFVVKTRAHHAFSLLRNLYEGLVMAGDQNRKVQDLSQLVTLSHNWDR